MTETKAVKKKEDITERLVKLEKKLEEKEEKRRKKKRESERNRK